jgi:hypothetical protein
MSVCCPIISQIFDLVQLKIALSQLELKLQNSSEIKTTDGKIHMVDVVILDPHGKKIGFEKTAKGNYEIVTDTAGLTKTQLKSQADFVKKIRQRYSYTMVIDRLKKDGYVIAEEEKVQNNTIRLVARKWS